MSDLEHKLIMPKEEYEAVFGVLSEYYPKLFIKDKVKLLKIRILDDIAEDNKTGFNKTKLRKFFRIYCNSKEYRKLHVQGALRYDLLGDEAGIVSKEQIDNMHKNEQEKAEQQKHKAAKKQEQQAKQHAAEIGNRKPAPWKPVVKSIHANKPKLGLKL